MMGLELSLPDLWVQESSVCYCNPFQCFNMCTLSLSIFIHLLLGDIIQRQAVCFHVFPLAYPLLICIINNLMLYCLSNVGIFSTGLFCVMACLWPHRELCILPLFPVPSIGDCFRCSVCMELMCSA